MSAIRLARGYTGRDVIVKFAGCYHGHVDSLLVAAGSSATTLGVPNSPGIPKGCTADTLVLRFNDVVDLKKAFQAYSAKIAGVILEPVVGNMGLVVPRKEFLDELRRLTQQHGALLIYDEVMTGFRLALGGAQELFGQKLAAGLGSAATEAGVPHQLQRAGSMWTLFFNADPVTDYDSAKKSDTARFARFFWAMMDRGIYLPCSQFEAAFLSAAMSETHIDETIAAARDALRALNGSR